MNQYNDTENSDHLNDEENFVSKTQLKNEAKALQAFGKQLTELPATKLELLPLSDTTIFAIKDFHKQSGNIAKKRHLAFIGKCLRGEDCDAVKSVLEQDDFGNQRKQKQQTSNDELVDELLKEGDVKVHQLLQEHLQLDRQKLRQLIRNISKAEEGPKKESAKKKLNQYLVDNQVS